MDSVRFELDSVTHVIALGEEFPEYLHCIEPTLPDQAAPGKRPTVVTVSKLKSSFGFPSLLGSLSALTQDEPTCVFGLTPPRCLSPICGSSVYPLNRPHLAVRLKEEQFSCRSAMIFSGLCVAASKSEISKADRELISSIVSAYGGLWREDHFFDVNVFLTTTNSSSKLRKIINTPGKQTICVAPQWISDSWRLQKRLPLDSYQFHHGQAKPPPCFAGRTASGSPLTSPRRDRVAMSLTAGSKRSITDNDGKGSGANREKSVFRGKSVLLARDVCRASEQQLRSLEHFIRISGGTVRRAPKALNGIAQAVRNSDFVVCRYREVQEFREAIRQSKQVGNLTWLIWVVSNDAMTDPREEPLHFPVPRQGIPEFKNASITISNYRGATRQYLTKMIKLMGATFSGTLTAQISLCVAANLKSEKTDKAREWKVPVVNHKYIVDSFLAWAPVERAKLKYIDFPEGVDYNLDVGEIRVTDESLGPWIDDAINNDEPEDMPMSDPVAPVLNFAKYASVEPSAAEPEPEPEQDPAPVRLAEERETTEQPLEEFRGEVLEPVLNRADSAGLEHTSPPATPSLSRERAPVQEEKTATSASSDRSSSPSPADAGAENVPLSPAKSAPSPRGTKRSRMHVLQDSVRQPTANGPDGEDTTSETEASSKKVKKGDAVTSEEQSIEAASDAPVRVATSNYKLKKAEETRLRSVGIDIVDDIEIADVLVTPKISRSPKMLYAIASGSIAIVSPDWLQACLKRREYIAIRTETGASPFHLVDREGEKTYGINLSDVMQRRETDFTQGIYYGHKFWLGRGVDENGSFSRLIEAAGGEVLPLPFDEEKLLSDPDRFHLVVGEDHTIEWRDLVGLPTVKGEPLQLYKKQLVTDCIFEQQPRWDRHLVDINRLPTSAGITPVKRGRATGKRPTVRS